MSETRPTPYYPDPDKGFALFRDAILCERHENWETIHQSYAPLVYSWVYQHPGFIHTGEDACCFVNAAFEKFWRALTPAKFTNFSDLKSLLAYLQLCVHSVIIDHLRAEKQHLWKQALPLEERFPCSLNIEQKLQQEAWQQEFWAYVNKRLKDDKERQLLYYRYVCGIKPSDICAQFGEIFPDVREVYTLTQKILARLAREPVLADYWTEQRS